MFFIFSMLVILLTSKSVYKKMKFLVNLVIKIHYARCHHILFYKVNKV